MSGQTDTGTEETRKTPRRPHQTEGAAEADACGIGDDAVRRGAEMAKGRILVVDDEPSVCELITTRLALEGYEEGRWDEVHVVYNEFKNTISQNRIVEPFLPIPSEQFVTPVMEREVEHHAEAKEGVAVDYIFEPDASTILETLVPRYLNFQLWRVMLPLTLIGVK